MIYPWQHNLWKQLTTQHNQPHAWLMYGQAGIGKLDFAKHFAQLLLCENPTPDHQPCEQCVSCHLFAQNSHPDLFELTPEKPEGDNAAKKLPQIKIDIIRQAIEFAQLSSHRGGKRIILLYPVENMNTNAANALLKILEEPPESVLFLLITHNKDLVLPTIRSRCRLLAMPTATQKQALDYLQDKVNQPEELLAFHGHVPLFEYQPEQAQLRENLLSILAQPRLLAILDYANDYETQKLPLALILEWLQKWLSDLARVHHQLPARYYPTWQNTLEQLAQQIEIRALFTTFDQLTPLIPYGYHTLNVKIQIQALLFNYLTFYQQKPIARSSERITHGST